MTSGPLATGRDEAADGAARVAVAPAGGLSSAEAADRLARYGPNELPRARRTPLWRLVGGQLRDPLILVLLAAAVLTVATGDLADASVILLVIVVNTTVGVTQEIKASQAIAALSDLAAPEARVLRDGGQRQIPAAEVVIGDVLVLAEGDIVPADADVADAAALLVDGAALTGESAPVDKAAAGPGGRGDVVSAGTVVVRGRGRAVVTATGAASSMGRVASLLGADPGLTPLQRRLAGVGRVLAVVAVALCAIVLAIGLVRGQQPELMVIAAISLVVAAVPESLPAVVTLALALGARRMSARNALIRRLPAVETLGSVTVLGTDKTGTMTEGNMVVRRLWTPGGEAEISGTGYGPGGEVTRAGQPVHAGDAPDLAGLLTAAALCNDAALRPPAESRQAWTAVGDPTEAALLAAAGKAGLSPAELGARFPRIAEVPFDSVRKRMTTVNQLPGGGARVICKGAPEAVLAPETMTGDAATVNQAIARAGDLAREGFRVLAVAAASRPGPPPAAEMERGLRLLGLIAILDPPRASAAATIASCQAAGITPVLITGDHPATARAIATSLGIIGPGEPVIDCRLALDAETARTATVFARATPEQKVTIIAGRQAAGDVVAMTGDGVNDGPALRRADIGVAMGKRGTEVARQAADLVLLPAQILWVNLLTHGPPGVALGSEPADPGIMRRPPRPPAESVLGAGLWQRIARVGVIIAVVTLAVALWGHATGRPWQSMAFLALGTTQLAVAAGSRVRPGTLANLALPAAIAVSLALQLAGLYVPFLRDLLHTQPLPATDLLIVGALSTLGYAAVRLDRIVHRDKPATATARHRRPA